MTSAPVCRAVATAVFFGTLLCFQAGGEASFPVATPTTPLASSYKGTALYREPPLLAWTAALKRASRPARRRSSQDTPHTVILEPGASKPVPGSNITVFFERVVHDSRCPKGVTCVWEGDAEVSIRVQTPDTVPSSYILHTNPRFAREIEHAGIRIRLLELAPYPVADRNIRPADYRLTLAIHSK